MRKSDTIDDVGLILLVFTIIFFNLSSAQGLGYIGVSTAICAIIVFTLAKLFRKKEPHPCPEN